MWHTILTRSRSGQELSALQPSRRSASAGEHQGRLPFSFLNNNQAPRVIRHPALTAIVERQHRVQHSAPLKPQPIGS